MAIRDLSTTTIDTVVRDLRDALHRRGLTGIINCSGELHTSGQSLAPNYDLHIEVSGLHVTEEAKPWKTEILEKQLQLLSKRSHEAISDQDIAILTVAMLPVFSLIKQEDMGK